MCVDSNAHFSETGFIHSLNLGIIATGIKLLLMFQLNEAVMYLKLILPLSKSLLNLSLKFE